MNLKDALRRIYLERVNDDELFDPFKVYSKLLDLCNDSISDSKLINDYFDLNKKINLFKEFSVKKDASKYIKRIDKLYKKYNCNLSKETFQNYCYYTIEAFGEIEISSINNNTVNTNNTVNSQSINNNTKITNTSSILTTTSPTYSVSVVNNSALSVNNNVSSKAKKGHVTNKKHKKSSKPKVKIDFDLNFTIKLLLCIVQIVIVFINPLGIDKNNKILSIADALFIGLFIISLKVGYKYGRYGLIYPIMICLFGPFYYLSYVFEIAPIVHFYATIELVIILVSFYEERRNSIDVLKYLLLIISVYVVGVTMNYYSSPNFLKIIFYIIAPICMLIASIMFLVDDDLTVHVSVFVIYAIILSTFFFLPLVIAGRLSVWYAIVPIAITVIVVGFIIYAIISEQ